MSPGLFFLSKELITKDEFYSMPREQDVDDINQVKEAYVKGDYNISIISKESEQHKHSEKDYEVEVKFSCGRKYIPGAVRPLKDLSPQPKSAHYSHS